MALRTEKPKKLYYSIKEVAQMFDVTESLLRYWETEFPQIKPKTTGNRVRQYTENDINEIRNVYNLVKVRGFKIAAARKMLHHSKKNVDSNTQVMERLIRVREDLKDLKKQLDYLT
jgi:DNA-binding transcriptional MerR regulator